MAGSTSQAAQVFLDHHDRLLEAITTPVKLASKLIARRLIGTATNSEVVSSHGASSSTKASLILEDVRVGLDESSQPDAFLICFCEVLEASGTTALVGIAASMRSALEGEARESSSPPPGIYT